MSSLHPYKYSVLLIAVLVPRHCAIGCFPSFEYHESSSDESSFQVRTGSDPLDPVFEMHGILAIVAYLQSLEGGQGNALGAF